MRVLEYYTTDSPENEKMDLECTKVEGPREAATLHARSTTQRRGLVIAMGVVALVLIGAAVLARNVLFPEVTAARTAKAAFEQQYVELLDVTTEVYDPAEEEPIHAFMAEDRVIPTAIGFPIDDEEYAAHYFVAVRATTVEGGALHFVRDYLVVRPRGSLGWDVYPDQYPR